MTESMNVENDASSLDVERVLHPFTTYSEVLAQASDLFQSRARWRDAITNDLPDEAVEQKEKRYRDLQSGWHARVTMTSLPLCRRDVDLGLTDLERELLWGLLDLHFGARKHEIDSNSVFHLFDHLAISPQDRILAISSLTPHGSLATQSLIVVQEDEDGDPLRSELILDSGVVREVLRSEQPPVGSWVLEHEDELYTALRPLYRLAERNADEASGNRGYNRQRIDFHRRSERLQVEWRKLELTLKQHPTWSWNRPEVQALPSQAVKILVLLTARALDVLPEYERLFTGQGLAAVLSRDLEGYQENYRFFRPTNALLSENWIRPVAGDAEHYTGQASEVERTRFELDDRAYEMLNLKRGKDDTHAGVVVREPRVTLDHLSLSSSVRESVRLTLVHARSENLLLRDWGLAERVPYGLHPVLLFYGPPGTGKTATAEAVAHALGRPLMVADYSRIHGPFLGQSERNIARVFQDAQRKRAVLFWDEADAMIFDRDNATRSWEILHVNLLLQELERFQGVCILATNRREGLDKALSRRISMQVEFQRPSTSEERLRIWKAMLPPQLPLADDVDLVRLAEEDLAGGEMKNVMLNAARIAAARDDEEPRLSYADFERAVQCEVRARGRKNGEIGFVSGQVSGNG